MKDSLGNELKEGQRVQIVLQSPICIGYVTKIAAGGIVSGLRRGGADVKAAELHIQCPFVIPIDPTSPVATSVTRVHTPEGTEKPVEEPKLVIAN